MQWSNYYLSKALTSEGGEQPVLGFGVKVQRLGSDWWCVLNPEGTGGWQSRVLWGLQLDPKCGVSVPGSACPGPGDAALVWAVQFSETQAQLSDFPLWIPYWEGHHLGVLPGSRKWPGWPQAQCPVGVG